MVHPFQMGYELPREVACAKYPQKRKYGHLREGNIKIRISQKKSYGYNLSLWIEPDFEFEHLHLVFLCILKTNLLIANQNLLMNILAGYRSEVRSNT